MEETAVFEFFVRKLPKGRNFLVAAGLEQALEYLENLNFTKGELQWIASQRQFQPDFIEYLGGVTSMRWRKEPFSFLTNRFCESPPMPQEQFVESRSCWLISACRLSER